MSRRQGSASSRDCSCEADGERRDGGERRRNGGLLELRARRDGVAGDRRRTTPGGHRSRLRAIWRRVLP